MSDVTPAAETPAVPEGDTFPRSYVEELRTENAGLRVGNKQALEAAKTETRAAVIAEYEPKVTERDTQIADLTTQLSDKSLELLKLQAIVNAKVPVEQIEDVYGLVQGTDEDTVSASVKRVQALMGSNPPAPPATDPSQGRGGDHVIPLNGDAITNAVLTAIGGR